MIPPLLMGHAAADWCAMFKVARKDERIARVPAEPPTADEYKRAGASAGATPRGSVGATPRGAVERDE